MIRILIFGGLLWGFWEATIVYRDSIGIMFPYSLLRTSKVNAYRPNRVQGLGSSRFRVSEKRHDHLSPPGLL